MGTWMSWRIKKEEQEKEDNMRRIKTEEMKDG